MARLAESRARLERLPGIVVNGVIVVLVVTVLFGLTGLLDPYRTFQLATACAMFCAVAGLTTLTGLTGQVSLGHGALMAIGAYSAGLVMQHLFDDGVGPVTRLVVGLAAAVIVSAFAGWLLGLAGARLEGPYLAGVTLALVVAIPAVATVFDDLLKGENGIAVPFVEVPETWAVSVSIERWQALIGLIAAGIVALVVLNLTTSRTGRIWRAGRDNEIATTLAGVNVGRMRVLAFTVSAACAGLGGGVLAVLNGQVNPGGFGLALSIQLLTAMVLGGLGSLAGAAVGSFVIVWLPTFLSSLIASWSMSPTTAQRLEGNLPIAIYGLALILVMLLAPRGLKGIVSGALQLATGRRRRSTGHGGASGVNDAVPQQDVLDDQRAGNAPVASNDRETGPRA